MRIVSGKYKGRIFHPPKNIRARPTTDFAKENLFNILENQKELEGLKALDLFAGTGNISFELISRGCAGVVAVEKVARHVAFIHRVTEQLEISNLHIIKKDAFQYLRTCRESFDIIFADPPYRLTGAEEIPEMVFDRKLLNNKGILILEHDKNIRLKDTRYLTDQRKYGTVHFSFFSSPTD